jgi:dGTPase
MPHDQVQKLADYAVADGHSAGRVHAEATPAPGRGPFEIDRTRVLQTTAFRRLTYKTQVFVTHEHDHFRTRLTHTLEVAEIARRLAATLGVNQVLAETIALAHDLGHPPFGHAGEAALNELMRDHGGFEHNAQSLRIVDYLEHPFPPFRGLNLTFEVREGLAKHETAYDHPVIHDPAVADLLTTGPQPSIEGQIASLADRLAYDCHDLEDALGAGLIEEGDLVGVELWCRVAEPVRRQYPNAGLPAVRRPILDALADTLIDDAAADSHRRIKAGQVRSPDDVRRLPEPLVGVSPTLAPALQEWDAFLRDRVYQHPRLVEMDRRAGQIVADVANAYRRDPSLLPARFAGRIPESGVERVVCDYVAGMTDRFCRHEHERLST